MGAIVGVKAKTPEGEWVELYKGKALVSEYDEYKLTTSYWKWAPAICRTHFLATDFRVEVDTNSNPNPNPNPNLDPKPKRLSA